MLFLSKKRVMAMLCMIFISVYAFTFKIVNNTENIINMEKTAETVATPVTNKVVIIDAGHGTPDEGDCLLTLNNNN